MRGEQGERPGREVGPGKRTGIRHRVSPGVESLDDRLLMAAELGAAVEVAGIGSRVDQAVEQILARNHIPGMAVAVTYNGEVVVAKGYGLANVTSQTPVTSATGFAIGSVSKTFTAEAVLLLTEKPGLIKKPGITALNLDLPISTYLSSNDGFSLPENWKGITTRQLLNMSSGIQDAGNPEFAWYEVVHQIGKDPLLFPPGTEYLYSNANYWLLGELIGQLTDAPYNDFITEQILQPLGMSETVVLTGSETSIPGQATGYKEYDSQSGTWTLPGAYYSGESIFSAGAIVSTPTDLGKYLEGLWNREILNPSTYNLMWTPTPLKNFKTPTIISTPGLGWCDGQGVKVTSQGVVINKNGAVPGYESQVSLYLGQGFGIAISGNLSANITVPANPQVGQLIQEINTALITAGVSGVVYADPDGSGGLEPHDTRLAGWQVYLDGNNNGQLDPDEPFTLTNADGSYSFNQVAAGPTVVRLALPLGWGTVSPSTDSYGLSLKASEVRNGLNFGVDRLAQVIALTRQGTGRSTGVNLRFNEAINPATATNLGNYTVLLPLRDRRLGTTSLVPIRLRKAAYDPATRSVTLTSRRTPFLLNRAVQVVVLGSGVKNQSGLALDGSGDGQPGSNFVGILGARLPRGRSLTAVRSLPARLRSSAFSRS